MTEPLLRDNDPLSALGRLSLALQQAVMTLAAGERLEDALAALVAAAAAQTPNDEAVLFLWPTGMRNVPTTIVAHPSKRAAVWTGLEPQVRAVPWREDRAPLSSPAIDGMEPFPFPPGMEVTGVLLLRTDAVPLAPGLCQPLADHVRKTALLAQFALSRRRAEERLRLIGLLQGAMTSIGGSLDLEEVAARAAVSARKLLPPDDLVTGIVIMSHRGDGQAAAYWTGSQGTEDVIAVPLPLVEYPDDLRPALQGQGERVLLVEPRGKGLPAPLRDRRWACAVPLRARGRDVGALVAGGNSPVVPGPDRLNLLSTFASYLAVALENARLFALEREHVEELRAQGDLRVRFLANLAHEIQTPIAAIKGSAELLTGPLALRTASRQTRGEVLSTLVLATDRLSALSNDLFDLFKLRSGDPQIEIESAAPLELAREALDLTQHRFRDKGQKVVLDVSPDLPKARVDRRRIGQVLVNLLNNAWRHTPEEALVTVAAARSGRDIVFTVRDTGGGISPEEQRYIFEPFQSFKRRGGRSGLGLGLTIARTLVELHGGRIWVDSEVGKGSAFHFTVHAEGDA